jgi:hypothetical protein
MKTFALALVAFAAGAASADVRTFFGNGVGTPVVPQQLDLVGIGSGNAASENAATSFLVPGGPSDNVDLSFTFRWDTGSFEFAFGFANVSGIGFNPVTQRAQWAAEALSPSRATLVFDDRNVDPVVTSPSFSISGGQDLVFFIVPDNTLANFRADPAAFYTDSTGLGGGDSALRSPLFSFTDANPGQFDQMLSFAANGVTMFAFEDLARTGSSDESFADLIFTVNAEIVPAPGAAALLGLAGVFAGRRRR